MNRCSSSLSRRHGWQCSREVHPVGLQKWVFNGTSGNLAYTLTDGLSLGTPYPVPGYPTGDNPATGLP
jgi:hypothetical protein